MNTSDPWEDGGDLNFTVNARNVPEGGGLVNVTYGQAQQDHDLLLFMSGTSNATFSNYTNTSNIHSDSFVPPAPESDGSSNALVWSSFFLLFCFLARPTIPDASQRTAQVRQAREDQRQQVKKDPQRRKRIVAGSLITKHVITCDENKTLRLGDVSGSTSLEESSSSLNSIEDEKSSNSIDDENVSQCVICLDNFQPGDCVTWSKSMECLHVFHQECLESWLANPKHDDCPSCRCQIIHDDGNDASTIIVEDDDAPSSSLAFVIMNGLVSPLRRANYSVIGSSISTDDDIEDDDIKPQEYDHVV